MIVNCPHCQREIEAGPEHSEAETRCPYEECGGAFIMPLIEAENLQAPEVSRSIAMVRPSGNPAASRTVVRRKADLMGKRSMTRHDETARELKELIRAREYHNGLFWKCMGWCLGLFLLGVGIGLLAGEPVKLDIMIALVSLIVLQVIVSVLVLVGSWHFMKSRGLPGWLAFPLVLICGALIPYIVIALFFDKSRERIDRLKQELRNH